MITIDFYIRVTVEWDAYINNIVLLIIYLIKKLICS